MHSFFLIVITCSSLLFIETCMETYADYRRVQEQELFDGPAYYASRMMGDMARFVLFVVIMLLLLKNEETF